MSEKEMVWKRFYFWVLVLVLYNVFVYVKVIWVNILIWWKLFWFWVFLDVVRLVVYVCIGVLFNEML